MSAPLQAEKAGTPLLRAMSPQDENGFTSHTPRVSFNWAGKKPFT